MHDRIAELRPIASAARLHRWVYYFALAFMFAAAVLRAVMRETKGNQVRAAQLLGINRNTLRKKLKEHGIDPDAV